MYRKTLKHKSIDDSPWLAIYGNHGFDPCSSAPLCWFQTNLPLAALMMIFVQLRKRHLPQRDDQAASSVYVPTCIHLFPHARTDTIQVVEHEPNFSKFYPLTISFLFSQFCKLESSLCVSSSDYYLISPFCSSLIRTTECTHQTTVGTQNELMIDNNVDLCANPIIDRLRTKELNTRAIQ